jgi:hypothetical protein
MSDFQVMFCCNDDRGNFAGRVEAIEIHDEIRLFSPKATPPVMKWTERPAYTNVQVGRRAFSCRNHQAWVGNWCWDTATMTEKQALLLIKHLLETGWVVEEWAESGPFSQLVAEHRTTP